MAMPVAGGVLVCSEVGVAVGVGGTFFPLQAARAAAFHPRRERYRNELFPRSCCARFKRYVTEDQVLVFRSTSPLTRPPLESDQHQKVLEAPSIFTMTLEILFWFPSVIRTVVGAAEAIVAKDRRRSIRRVMGRYFIAFRDFRGLEGVMHNSCRKSSSPYCLTP